MKRFVIFITGISFLLISLLISFSVVLAQGVAPIQILLRLHNPLDPAKEIYLPDEPIPVKVQVSNISGANVITRKGFFSQEFHLKITLLDPDGLPVTRKYETADPEPGPPYRLEEMNVAFGEEIKPFNVDDDPPILNAVLLDDIRAYFNMPGKFGWYTAEINVPLETFAAFLEFPDTSPLYNKLVNLDEPKEVFNPLVSNKIRFKIESPTLIVKNSVNVNVSLLKIDPSSRPVVQRSFLEGAKVRVIKASNIPEDFYPIGWKVYSHIWSNVDPELNLQTNADGSVSCPGLEQDNYLILVECPITARHPYVGSLLPADDEQWTAELPVEMDFRVIQLPDRTKLPGKTTKLKGSKLLITQPDFVEWDGNQAAYPFVFETIGDWQIETSIAPPKGFKTDYKSKKSSIKNEIKTVQFTLTDAGGVWEETKVKYKIKHKKKTISLESKIGIKLSKKLAKEKKKGVYGDTWVPGPFKGGRKIKKENDKEKK